MKDLLPIFISGHPKSGTTLLVALLDSHPELLVFPEELKMRSVIPLPTMEEKIDYLLTSTGAYLPGAGQVSGAGGENLRDYSEIDGDAYLRDLEEGLRRAGDDKELLLAVFENWRDYAEVRHPDTWKYFVEKTPSNEFARERYREWFPGARFLQIVRDPRDNYVSYRKLHPELRLFEFIRNWKNSTRIGLSPDETGCTLLVKYEDLIADPEANLRRICEWLDIGFRECLMEPTRNGVPWKGNSMFRDDTGGIHTQGIGRYRQRLEPGTIKRLETYLFDEMSSLGYAPELARAGREIPAFVTAGIALTEWARHFAMKAKRCLGLKPRRQGEGPGSTRGITRPQ